MTKSTTIKWENISITSPEFLKAESEQSLTQFFHEYFSKNSTTNSKFLIELADHYPQVLINSIRLNRAFLKQGHRSSLNILKTHPNVYCKNHYAVFTKLAEYENDFYYSFCEASQKINSLNPLEIFCWISLWFENKRATLFLSQGAHILPYDINEYIETINFFLSYYFFENKEVLTSAKFKINQDWDIWPTVLKEAESLNDLSIHPVWETLDKAGAYLYFLQGTIETYSFDLNFEVNLKEDIAELKYINENKLKRWHIESAKLSEWYDYNRTFAIETVNQKLQADPKFIEDKTGFDYEMNYNKVVNIALSEKIANDFCLNESTLAGVPNSLTLKVLRGFTSNAWGRYVNPMDKLNFINPSRWLKHISTNAFVFGNVGISAIPTLMLSKDDFIKTIEKNEQNNEFTEQVVNLISSNVKNLKYFDRLNPQINLIGKPFLKINDFYFAFNGILGETNLQVSFLINTMQSNWVFHNQVESKEVEQMEKNVKLMLNNAGFPNVICSTDYFQDNKRKGNFDAVAYENGVLLLIELKRSKMRIHLSDAHDEHENSLSKASNQLEKATKYISENFEKCKNEYFKELHIKETKYSQLKVYPIIVSTSFENDHVLINGKHLKISYYEFQRVLEFEIEIINSNKLESFVYSLISSKFWEHLEKTFEIPHLNIQALKFKV